MVQLAFIVGIVVLIIGSIGLFMVRKSTKSIRPTKPNITVGTEITNETLFVGSGREQNGLD